MLAERVRQLLDDLFIDLVPTHPVAGGEEEVLAHGSVHLGAVDRDEQMVGKIVELERSADEISGQASVDLAVDREEDPVWEVALLEFLLEDDDPVREPSDIAQV